MFVIFDSGDLFILELGSVVLAVFIGSAGPRSASLRLVLPWPRNVCP